MNIDKLKQLKRDAGYTNRMISDESGVPLGTVQKIFSGETRSPRYETIRKLEAVLNKPSVNTEYRYVSEGIMMTAEPQSMYGDYYNYRKQLEKTHRYIHKSDYSPVPISNRLGIAAGKFQVPDDEFFYNDEISDMFEDL